METTTREEGGKLDLRELSQWLEDENEMIGGD